MLKPRDPNSRQTLNDWYLKNGPVLNQTPWGVPPFNPDPSQNPFLKQPEQAAPQAPTRSPLDAVSDFLQSKGEDKATDVLTSWGSRSTPTFNTFPSGSAGANLPDIPGALSSPTSDALGSLPQSTAAAPTTGWAGLGAGGQAGVVAGAALLGKGVKDLYTGKKTKGWEGWGGRAQLAVTTGGLSEVGRLFGLGRKPTSKGNDEKRWRALEKQGVTVPWADTKVGGNQVDPNSKFQKSRNVKDLTGRDIWGYSAFAENLGNDWGRTSEANREAIANKALQLGKVREGKGTVKLDWSPELDSYARDLISGKPAKNPPVVPGTNQIPKAGRK